MVASSGSGEREPALRAWLEQLLGGAVVDWQRLVAGNSRTTYAADLASGPQDWAVVVRTDTGDGPFSDTPLTLAREASIYVDLQDRGLALPRIYGFDPSLAALVLQRVPGTSHWDERVLDALLAQLGRLHRVAVTDLHGHWRAAGALDDLEMWAGIARCRVRPVSPLVEFAVGFLRERYPGEPSRLVVVHGDAGPGNLLWDGERITAMLDWELAHVGDPMDDLAFLSVRAALHGIELSDFEQRVRTHYAAVVEIPLDGARLRYWQAVGVLRNLVTCLASISNPVRGRDRLVHHLLVPALNRMLVGALAQLAGIQLEPPTPAPAGNPLPGAEVLSEVAKSLTELMPSLAEEPRQRARRMRYLLDQLAGTWELIPGLARMQEADCVRPEEDAEATLHRLARSADRALGLFPQAARLADRPLASFS
jgi:aminoglycoside phosphotransferase (APT) family kinase protein